MAIAFPEVPDLEDFPETEPGNNKGWRNGVANLPSRRFIEVKHWVSQAACRGLDTSLFYPSRGEWVEKPKEICSQCQVREECLEYSLEAGEEHGVWGGVTERGRRRLRRQCRLARAVHVDLGELDAGLDQELEALDPTAAEIEALQEAEDDQQSDYKKFPCGFTGFMEHGHRCEVCCQAFQDFLDAPMRKRARLVIVALMATARISPSSPRAPLSWAAKADKVRQTRLASEPRLDLARREAVRIGAQAARDAARVAKRKIEDSPRSAFELSGVNESSTPASGNGQAQSCIQRSEASQVILRQIIAKAEERFEAESLSNDEVQDLGVQISDIKPREIPVAIIPKVDRQILEFLRSQTNEEVLDGSGRAAWRVANGMGMNQQAISVRLVHLVGKGFVERDKGPNPRCKRTYALRLTDEGRIAVASSGANSEAAITIKSEAQPELPRPAPLTSMPASSAATVAPRADLDQLADRLIQRAATAIRENGEMKRREIETTKLLGSLRAELERLTRQNIGLVEERDSLRAERDQARADQATARGLTVRAQRNQADLMAQTERLKEALASANEVNSQLLKQREAEAKMAAVSDIEPVVDETIRQLSEENAWLQEAG